MGRAAQAGRSFYWLQCLLVPQPLVLIRVADSLTSLDEQESTSMAKPIYVLFFNMVWKTKVHETCLSWFLFDCNCFNRLCSKHTESEACPWQRRSNVKIVMLLSYYESKLINQLSWASHSVKLQNNQQLVPPSKKCITILSHFVTLPPFIMWPLFYSN